MPSPPLTRARDADSTDDSHRGARRSRLAPPLGAAFALLAAAAAAVAGASGDLDASVRALRSALDRADAGAIAPARAQLDSLAAGTPRLAAPRRWLALADWRLAVLALASDTAAAARLAARGESLCGLALKLDPRDSETLSLRAGLRVTLAEAAPGSPAAATLDAAARSDLDRALSLAPRNPRAWLFQSLAVLRRPAAAGGGPRAAQGVLAKALELFASAPRDTAGAAWGWDDAYLWSGRCAMSLGDFDRACQMYSRALEINPRNAWVHRSLLPAARDSLRGGPGS